MNAVGVKVGAYPEDAAMQQIKMESDAQKREIMGNINRYGRQLNRNGIDQKPSTVAGIQTWRNCGSCRRSVRGGCRG